MQKTFELFERESEKGVRRFKVILHEIYPDACVINGAGQIFNKNGITWLKEFCERSLPSLVNKSITAEFLNSEKTELHSHGQTGLVDGLPVFEDAEVIGHFTGGSIEEIEDEYGNVRTFAIGEGLIDEFRYRNLCEKLDADLAQGNMPKGSVEIYKKEENDSIIYQYGYKPEGRIPMEFNYSGYALLGVEPADDTAVMLELNEKGETEMNEAEVKALISASVNEVLEAQKLMEEARNEANAKAEEAEKSASEAAEKLEAADVRIAELVADIEEIKAEVKEKEAEIEKLKADLAEASQKIEDNDCANKKREMAEALEKFSDEEKAYAKAELEAFEADPMNAEINSVLTAIYAGIGKNSHDNKETSVSEVNSAEPEIVDIFSEVEIEQPASEKDIFSMA